MLLKIPLIGWISDRVIVCSKCKKPISRVVSSVNVYDGMPFHFSCGIDYIAEKEGWVEYREHYKATQRKYVEKC